MTNLGEIVFWMISGLLGLKILINFWMAYVMAVQKWKSVNGKSKSQSLMPYLEFGLLFALLLTAFIKHLYHEGPSRFNVVGFLFVAVILSYFHLMAVALITGILDNRRRSNR